MGLDADGRLVELEGVVLRIVDEVVVEGGVDVPLADEPPHVEILELGGDGRGGQQQSADQEDGVLGGGGVSRHGSSAT